MIYALYVDVEGALSVHATRMSWSDGASRSPEEVVNEWMAVRAAGGARADPPRACSSASSASTHPCDSQLLSASASLYV